ncbi:MAG TPA: L,D-transpeptidase [Mycobacteriales bacterium]|nr:L,D-transpeptidase [Mycobacteriales bacterium]
MTSARRGRTLLGAAISLTLAAGVATAVAASPAQTPTPAGTSRVSTLPSYARLLTAPLRGDSADPTLQAAAHTAAANSSPCAGNTRRRLVLVSIEHQHLWACSAGKVSLSTPVTTGKATAGDATPRGDFVVNARVADTTLHPASGLVIPVAYWIPFKGDIYGFHNAPWQTMPYGSRDYRTEGSIGCVHVPLEALRRLFDWVHVGTAVRIS